MKAASLSEIKKELSVISTAQLMEITLRLAKHKVENKELLTYLLFDAADEKGYIIEVKNEMENQFQTINTTNLYFAKKSIRKILRFTNKHCRYVSNKEAQIELLFHFCSLFKDSSIAKEKSVALMNLYHGQIKKLETQLSILHEDVQYDYKKMMERLT